MASKAKGSSDMTRLGRISGLYGVKGWLKVYSDTDPRDNILTYSPWYLQRQNGTDEWQRCDVKAGRIHGKGLVVHLEGCDDRDAAAELVGCTVAIKREQLPETSENEYYWSDLIGLQVQTTEGVELGVVSHLMETGANDVLVVKSSATGDKENERLIPFILEQVVKTVDLEAGRLVVDWDPEF